ncbi:MAG: response regulator [Proteobacteria bacterium]|nr:response regulator [Pseudomonadota bacterium]MDA1023735.1 response regulator [Pseudomonadota bacterium]
MIDDNADYRAELKLSLEKSGHVVRAAAGGNEGLALFAEQPVDVVITDVIMDEGEGVETMRQLHRLAPGLPVIAISGNPSYLKSMEKLGAFSWLLKPFSFKELNEAVGKVL